MFFHKFRKKAPRKNINAEKCIKTQGANSCKTEQDSAQQSLVDQTGQLAGTPLMDPQKNPQLAPQAQQVLQNLTPPQE